MSDGSLFDPPAPEHPDAAVAREEIARYYEDRLTEATVALNKAQAAYNARLSDLRAWQDRGEITHDGPEGGFVGAPSMIASHAMSRWQRAATTAIYRDGDIAEAEDLGKRETALRRWLTAQGYDLGELAEPPPGKPRGGRASRA